MSLAYVRMNWPTPSWTPSDDLSSGGDIGFRLEVTAPDGDVGQDGIKVEVTFPPNLNGI